jgi:AAA domain/Bifunctional DNA primase/polymerase, N-terminal
MIGNGKGPSPIEHIRELVGERAIFVPIPWGKKGPNSPAWQSTTFEQTQAAEYQKQIAIAQSRGGNIGVLLGENSGDLVAIDIDEDPLVEEFFALNSTLRQTLTTRGNRGCQIWVRMVTENYPHRKADLKFKDGRKFCEWRGGGGCQSVIFGRHPAGNDYQILVDTPALQISFDEIVWPEGLTLPWNEEPPAAKTTNTQPAGSNDLHNRILAYLNTIPGAISGNGGHNQTYKAAMALVNGWARGTEEALGYMRVYNQRCKPHWTEEELRHKIDDAFKNEDKNTKGHLINAPFARPSSAGRPNDHQAQSTELHSGASDDGTDDKKPWSEALEQGACSSLELSTLPIQPRELLIDDWCRVGDLGFIFARRGVGKTWKAMHLAHGLASKTDVGPWKIHKQTKVLYLDGEMPPSDIKDRDKVLVP